ncbi:transcriptional regulator with XRE-family HTH domain [Sporosarcina luteola]|nr:transcriptional regulator with XRE-family HTH domain [Sporosarcina luteola]
MHENLFTLRKKHGYTQEKLAELIGVSRQAVAKWETGQTVPDIMNSQSLAELYDITLDQLVNHSDLYGGELIAPKGKYQFGFIEINESNSITLPEEALKLFNLGAGDSLLLLADVYQNGFAMLKVNSYEEFIDRKK